MLVYRSCFEVVLSSHCLDGAHLMFTAGRYFCTWETFHSIKSSFLKKKKDKKIIFILFTSEYVFEMDRWSSNFVSKHNLDQSWNNNLDKKPKQISEGWIGFGCCSGEVSRQEKWWCMENSAWLLPSCASPNWHKPFHSICHTTSAGIVGSFLCFWSSSSGTIIWSFNPVSEVIPFVGSCF